MAVLTRIDNILERFERTIIAVLCSAALLLGVMQVVLRYAFNTGVPWNEAVFVNCTIWAMLLGASRAIRSNLHARVELIAELIPVNGVYVCNLLAILATLALSAVYLIGGTLYVQFVHAMDISDIDSGIPDWITYGIVPVVMALFIFRYMIKLALWRIDPAEFGRTPGPDHTASGV